MPSSLILLQKYPVHINIIRSVVFYSSLASLHLYYPYEYAFISFEIFNFEVMSYWKSYWLNPAIEMHAIINANPDFQNNKLKE